MPMALVSNPEYIDEYIDWLFRCVWLGLELGMQRL